jgi:hypothetical protein
VSPPLRALRPHEPCEAQVAKQVFLDLTRELEEQGVSGKVSADMFGMALRAYIRKVRRLSEAQNGARPHPLASLARLRARAGARDSRASAAALCG